VAHRVYEDKDCEDQCGGDGDDFTGPKKPENSRAKPPLTSPSNGYARIQNIHTVSTKTRMARNNVEATETMARAPSHTREDARYSEGRVGVDRSTEPHSTFLFFF
jgi:hypothetical protein